MNFKTQSMQKIILFFLTLLTLAAKAQIPNTVTAEDKIYGLSKFWQEVNYNFVYLEKIDRVKWDSAYRVMIKTVQQTKNDYEYYLALQKFCALLKDGHTNVYFPKSIDTLIYKHDFGDYKIYLKNIDNKAIIIRTNQSKKDELSIGTEIIEVNRLPTQEYINQFIAPYISSSTDYALKDWAVWQLLAGMKGQKYEVKIKTPDGKTKILSLTHEKTIEKEIYPPLEDKQLLNFKWYDHQIAYISLNSFKNPKIDTLFIQKLSELYKAESLIIDLRFNGGGNGNVGRTILEYLTNDKLLYGSKSVTRNHLSTYKAWGVSLTSDDTINGKPEWSISKEEAKKCFLCFNDKYYYNFEYAPDTIKLNAKKIVIPTAILIGHNTASAAEDFLIYADRQKHMTKIGENTCGSTGQPFYFNLPGGGSAEVCTKKDTYPDGREFVGYGIKPDIEVKPTVNDYLQHNDPVLERALLYLQQKTK